MLRRTLSACCALLARCRVPGVLLVIAIAGVPAGVGAENAVQKTGVSSAPTDTALLYSAISKSIEQYFEPSYVTFGGGYNDQRGPLRSGDLLYEGQIYVHYTWTDTSTREGTQQDKDLVRIMLPVRLQVRQYTSESSPVKTPGYNPGVRMYYTRRSWFDRDGMYYLSAGLHHYSNGQSGPHYHPDRTINTENGSFSTDYAELSFYQHRTHSWKKLNFRKYLIGWIATWEPDQSHYYEKALVELTWRQDIIQYTAKRGTPYFQLTAGYKFNRDHISPGVNASFEDNLQFTAEFFFPFGRICSKCRWKDLRLYLRADRGFDYYNIHYQERMNRLQAGIIASNF